MSQHVVTALIVAASTGWIGFRLWRWAQKRRSKTAGGCGGCSKCGEG